MGDEVLCISEQRPFEISGCPTSLHVRKHQEKVDSTIGYLSSGSQVGGQMQWATSTCKVGSHSEQMGYS